MSQVQSTTSTSQPGGMIIPSDPTALLQNGNSPTAIILAIAILTRSVALLIQVLLPVMLQKKSASKK